ncbi:MAG: hypothetical protein ACRD8O_17585 [Bryobacteraceae bacterium]
MIELNQLRQMQREWRPPVELDRGRPRPVEFTAAGMWLAALVVMLLAGGVFGGIALYLKAGADDERNRLIEQSSNAIEARIERRWQTKGENRRCHVTYSFSSAGSVFRRSTRIPCSTWRKLSDGGTIQIRFVATNPALSRIAGLDPRGVAPYWLGPVLGVLTVVSGVLLAQLLLRRRRLLAEGRSAPGIVTRLGSKSAHGREVHYEFPTLSGARAHGKFGPVSEKQAPPIGSAIVVIYDAGEPARNSRYPLQAVRIRRG